MRSIFLACFFLFFIHLSCVNSSEKILKNYLIGTWRIENPTMQSFIKFKKDGRATYFFNRYSLQLDTLSEHGKWEVSFTRKKTLKDTFMLHIIKKNNIVFKAIILDSIHFLTFEKKIKTRLTRINNE